MPIHLGNDTFVMRMQTHIHTAPRGRAHGAVARFPPCAAIYCADSACGSDSQLITVMLFAVLGVDRPCWK